jgi:cytochrome b subunit of formate dehydrogenase
MSLRSKIRKNFYVVTYVLNLAMIPFFLVCLITGIILFPGFLELIHVRSRKLPMETIIFLHDWTGLVLGAGILGHLALHWRVTIQFIKVKVFRSPVKHRTPKNVEVALD